MISMKLPDNKILILILLVLIAVFVVSRKFRSPSRESNLPDKIFDLDTALVTEIKLLRPSPKKTEFSLIRKDAGWMVKRNQHEATTDPTVVRNALISLMEVKPDRIISRKKEKWSDYQVDSTGTQVVVHADGSALTNFWLGRSGSGTVYLRMDEENDVYVVSGALGSSLNKDFNDWRNRSFLQVKVDSISSIRFQYPADSSFSLSKRTNAWTIDDITIDSIRMQTFLNRFRSRNLNSFADDFVASKPDLTVTFSDQHEKAVETIRAWMAGDDQWIVASTLQPNSYFSVNRSQLNEWFASRKYFLD